VAQAIGDHEVAEILERETGRRHTTEFLGLMEAVNGNQVAEENPGERGHCSDRSRRRRRENAR
jgi:hypothetical protein